jgi:hypothetical protein
MKIFLFIFLFVLSLKADYLMQFESSNLTLGYCIKDYSFNGSFFTRTLSSDGSVSTAQLPVTNFIITDGYEFKNGVCSPKIINYNNLGITEYQFNFLSALTGLLTSILLVFIIFLKV